jgi:hypothetical protein
MVAIQTDIEGERSFQFRVSWELASEFDTTKHLVLLLEVCAHGGFALHLPKIYSLMGVPARSRLART